jgi:hypothetical protein
MSKKLIEDALNADNTVLEKFEAVEKLQKIATEKKEKQLENLIQKNENQLKKIVSNVKKSNTKKELKNFIQKSEKQLQKIADDKTTNKLEKKLEVLIKKSEKQLEKLEKKKVSGKKNFRNEAGKLFVKFVVLIALLTALLVISFKYYPSLLITIYFFAILTTIYFWKTEGVIIAILFAVILYTVLKIIDRKLIGSLKTDLDEITKPDDTVSSTDPQRNYIKYNTPYVLMNKNNVTANPKYYFYYTDCFNNNVGRKELTIDGYYYLFQFEKVKSKQNSEYIYFGDYVKIVTGNNDCLPKRYLFSSKEKQYLTANSNDGTIFILNKYGSNPSAIIEYEELILAKIEGSNDSVLGLFDEMLIVTNTRKTL